MRIGLLIPTLNAGALWQDVLDALAVQELQPARFLVIDSGSTDQTVDLARQFGAEALKVDRTQFDHGGTRQLGIMHLADCDVVVCLTQDAILAAPDALSALVSPLQDPRIALTWGRQLPHANATPFAAHARHFNYPPDAHVVGLADRQRLGIKAAFASNSFAAWRRQALLEVGGFPSNTLMGEDVVGCARLLCAGYLVAYAAAARAHHSHNYTMTQEFRRYVDVGAFHALERWLLDTFGSASGEGMRYVLSEQRFMAPLGWHWRVSAVVRSCCKWLGYRVGRLAPCLPRRLMRRFSMHPGWWLNGRIGGSRS